MAEEFPHERCDRCIAPATVKISLDKGGQLFMCSHHTRRYFPETGVYEGIAFTYATQIFGSSVAIQQAKPKKKWWR